MLFLKRYWMSVLSCVGIMMYGSLALAAAVDTRATAVPTSAEEAVRTNALPRFCERNPSDPYCQTPVSDDQRDLFQDLKNFLALTELKRNETAAKDKFQLPPDAELTRYIGYKANEMEVLDPKYVAPLQIWFSRWNALTSAETDIANLFNMPEVNLSYFVESRLAYGCSIDEQKAGLCATAKTDKPYDLEASSLLNKRQFSAVDGQDASHALQFIKNVTNPTPLPLLTRDEMFVDYNKKVFTDAGLKNLSARFKQQTLMSLAQQSLLKLYEERLPYEVPYGTGEEGNENIESLSTLELLRLDASGRRYEDKNWYSNISTLSSDALMREMVSMMALQLHMDYKRYEQMQRMEAMMAAQMAYTAHLVTQAELNRAP